MKTSVKLISAILLFVLMLAVNNNVLAQHKTLTTKDYEHAEKFLGTYTSPLVYGLQLSPNWIDDDFFWYSNTNSEGTEFILVNAKKKTRKPAFDHVKLATKLSTLLSENYNSSNLPLTQLEFSGDKKSVDFNINSYRYSYNIKTNICVTVEAKRSTDRSGILSPDGKKSAFIRDYNLWMRNLENGQETKLTNDGIEDFGYATNNAGWTKRDSPVLLWSPDSKKIATFQHDGRGVGEMYLVSTNVGHPTLEAWKYPLPEDSVIFRVHRVIIHTDGPKVVRLKMKPDQHRSTITDHIAYGGGLADAQWSEDASQFAFVSTSRDHKHEVLRIANPETGVVREVLDEKVETFFESGNGGINWKVLFASNEVIWFSERNNWGQLFLYDLTTGKLKNQITTGEWNVLKILKLDEKSRKIYFTGSCREQGDPYFHYLYSINMDGSDLTLLSPDNAHHTISLSPSGAYFVDTYSTPVIPPVTILRNTKGKKLLDLEKADVSRLLATGWKPVIPFSVKARDGKTDLYGQMYVPTNLDPTKKYPIINSIYPGPQSGSVGSRSYSVSRGDRQSLAELGFIVVTIDAMGTPGRSKSFHEAYYGNMGDNGLPDHITGMQQLAKKYPYIDIDKVGIYGHSGGGFASTDAILRYPDFFKVAVSGAGNHDNRNYEDDWGEKWQGLLTTNKDGTTSYDNQANQNLAGNLKGKLLLAHGTMDGNVPYYMTLLVVNELIAANKDFDLILFPNRGHGFSSESYMMRRRWDYFVKHLLNAQPPKEFEFKINSSKRWSLK
ncbi:DPP IV N-terminal domain-containing protein [Bacteroidota bacterium]